jgi:hypothetical protein
VIGSGEALAMLCTMNMECKPPDREQQQQQLGWEAENTAI